MPVQIALKAVGGGHALPAVRPAQHGQAGHDGVEDHEREQRPGQPLAQLIGNLEDPARHARIDVLDPHHAQYAPEHGIQKADAAVEIERQIAVIPRGRAEDHLLHPGADILHNAARDQAAGE